MTAADSKKAKTFSSTDLAERTIHRRAVEFEVLFRLYGPEKALFDKTWRLPDIEKVN